MTLFFFFFLLILFPCNLFHFVKGSCENEIKGMFVFGSSLVDNGNNNFLPKSLAKANYLPYGIDFPSGPSGRFTNGENLIDLLCHHLRLPLIPPFADPNSKGIKISHGVNFASGSSGILDETGNLAGEVVTLSQQIRNFEKISMAELEEFYGKRKEKLVAKYIFVIGTGGNDYSFNYFLRPSNASTSLQVFTANLTTSLSTQIQKLYRLGGRKFVLLSVNPIGCYPFVIQQLRTPNNSCIAALNNAANLFNAHLKLLVQDLKPQLPSSHFVIVNSYKILNDIITNPASRGFKNGSAGCCKIKSIKEGGNGILCEQDGKVCEKRSSHVFFDGLHPTEAVNKIIAAKAFKSSDKSEAYPINVQQLAMIK